jgi:hypothetical protein
MILILIFFRFLLLVRGNSVCPAEYHLEDLETGIYSITIGNIYFTVNSNNNQITTTTFHYYFVGIFTMVPNIALCTMKII